MPETDINLDDTHGPLVSVVVLSYNRPDSLRESLRCIFNQTYRNLEVLVMDNASSSPDNIRKAVAGFPEAKLYFARRNVGYTGGMNAGAALASGKYIYLTEDDMYSEPECVRKFVEYAELDPAAGMISGSVLSKETGELVCCGGTVRLAPIFSWSLYDEAESRRCPVSGPYCADYTTGAMMFFSRQTFAEVGGFRDDFFMYYEDVELCRRFQTKGLSVVIVPDARAYSWRGGNAPETTFVAYHKAKNFAAVYLLHAAPKVLPEFFLRYVLLGFFREMRSLQSWKTFLRANGWLLWNALKLWKERLRGFPDWYLVGAAENWNLDQCSRRE